MNGIVRMEKKDALLQWGESGTFACWSEIVKRASHNVEILFFVLLLLYRTNPFCMIIFVSNILRNFNINYRVIKKIDWVFVNVWKVKRIRIQIIIKMFIFDSNE